MNLYKLAKKVVSGKTTLTILRNAVVTNGMFHVTDLDQFLTLKTDLSDGFHVLDLLKHDMDQPQTGDLAEYPMFPKPKYAKKFKLSANIFDKKFEYFVSNDDTTMALKSVFFDKQDGSVIATDGHVAQLIKKVGKFPDSFMIPAFAYTTLKLIAKECGVKQFQVELSYGDITEVEVKNKAGKLVKKKTRNMNYIFFNFKGGSFAVKAVNGIYPNYQAVFPKDKTVNTLDFTKPQKELFNVLKGAFDIASTKNRMGVFGNNGKICIENLDKFEKPIILDGFKLNKNKMVGFNLGFLESVLKILADDKQKVSIKSDSVLVAHLFENKTRTILLMPARILAKPDDTEKEDRIGNVLYGKSAWQKHRAKEAEEALKAEEKKVLA